MTLPCTIPFPVDSYEQALDLKQRLIREVCHDTRGDSVSLQLHNGQWYVVLATGNITGMVEDLIEKGFL